MFIDVHVVVVLPLPDGHLFPVAVDVKQEAAVFVFGTLKSSIEQFTSHRNDLPTVIPSIAGRFDHLEPLLRSSFGIPEHAILLHPHGTRQNQISVLRGGRGIDIGHDQELVFQLATRMEQLVQIWKRLPGVRDLYPDRVDVPTLFSRCRKLLPHLHRVIARILVDRSRR